MHKLFTHRQIEKRNKNLEMKGNAGVRANAFFSSTKSPEIFSGFRDNIFVKLNHHSSFKLSTKAYVQIASRIRHFLLNSRNVSMEKKKKTKTLNEFLKERFMLQVRGGQHALFLFLSIPVDWWSVEDHFGLLWAETSPWAHYDLVSPVSFHDDSCHFCCFLLFSVAE